MRQRLEALYLQSEGWSHQAIGASVGITKPTLIGYLRRYPEGGWAALTACRFRRTRSALAPHEATIVLAFTRQPPATLAEASTRMAERTGLERSPAPVGQGLQQFGWKRRQTGAIPGPAPTPERQAERATFQEPELEPRLAQAQAGPRAVFFVDAAHFGWCPSVYVMSIIIQRREQMLDGVQGIQEWGWYPISQQFCGGPDVIRHARRHGWGDGPPFAGRPVSSGGFRCGPFLTQAEVGQASMIVGQRQPQRLFHPRQFLGKSGRFAGQPPIVFAPCPIIPLHKARIDRRAGGRCRQGNRI